MDKRFNFISTIIGRRGSGKTYYTRGLFETYIARGSKILVIDTFDHPSYTDLPIIEPKKLKYWRTGTYRMFGHDFQKEVLPALQFLKNTFIVFEDARKYVKSHIQEDLYKLCLDSKQKNIDILFLYHTWGFVPPGLIQIADFIELFPTSDSPENRKKYISGIYEDAMKAHNKIRSTKKKWPHITIDLRN